MDWNFLPESESQPSPSAMLFRLSIWDWISFAVVLSCWPNLATSYGLPGIRSPSVTRMSCQSEVVQPKLPEVPGT